MVGKWIDEALRKQVQGEEKVNVISHLLHGLFISIHDRHDLQDGVQGDGFVGFYEPHRKKKRRYYIHILTTLGGDKWLSALDLLCDHSIDLVIDNDESSSRLVARKKHYHLQNH